MKIVFALITLATLAGGCKKSEFSSSSKIIKQKDGNPQGLDADPNFNPNDKNTWPKDPNTNVAYNPGDSNTWPKDPNTNVAYNPGDSNTWPKDPNTNVAFNPGDSKTWPKNPTTGIAYNPNNPKDPNNPGITGGGITTAAECASNPIADASATFVTPLITNDYRAGDMGRNNTASESKSNLANLINPLCLQTYVPNSALGTALTNPQISSDRATRDTVCRLFGYNSAADNSSFGYWSFASPHNNTAAAWDASTNRLRPMQAYKLPVINRILVWTKCVGKMKDGCKNNYIANTFKCGI